MLLSPAIPWRNTPPKDGNCQIKDPAGRLAGQKVQFAWDIFPCLIRATPANQNARNLCSTTGIHLVESKNALRHFAYSTLSQKCHSPRWCPIIIRGHHVVDRHRRRSPGCSRGHMLRACLGSRRGAKAAREMADHLQAKGDWSGVKAWEAVATELLVARRRPSPPA